MGFFRWLSGKIEPCRHKEPSISMPLDIGDYTVNRRELLGVSLSWAATPVPVTRSHITCHLCGEDFTRDAYLPDRLWHGEYPPDETGWPTKDGERIPMMAH